MTEKYCRICFDNEDQEDMISPCGCKGSMEFIHKKCLNSWLLIHKHDDKYFKCNECKKEYKRYSPEDKDDIVNYKLLVNSLFTVIGTFTSLLILIFICGLSSFLSTVLLLILYLISVFYLCYLQKESWIWLLFIAYLCILNLGDKMKILFTDVWLIVSYIILNFYWLKTWDSIKLTIISDYMSKIKSQIFDYNKGQFVDGVV